MKTLKQDPHVVPRRALDFLFTFQILLNIVVLGFIVLFVIGTAGRLSQLAENQNAIIQHQNEIQVEQNNASLCAEVDIVNAVKAIGRKLGLPVDDIKPPQVEEGVCPVTLPSASPSP